MAYLYFFLSIFFYLEFNKCDSTGESKELLDYTESNWPDTCKGNTQSPINFPSNTDVNGTYFPVNNTKIIFNTYKQVSGISMYQVLPDAKFAFKQADMGELYFQKNGLFYKYILNELHFHYTSEHTFNGTGYDMEMHLVHSKDNNFFFSANANISSDPDFQQQKLVVGILFTKYDNKTNLNSNINNTFIQSLKMWDPKAIVDNFTLNDFSRGDKFFLHYEGSLTTPQCNQFVNWVVMTQLEKISSAQLTDFINLIKSKGYSYTNRKTKPINGRKIYYNDYATFSPIVLKSNGFYLTNNLIVAIFVIIILFIN